MEPDFTEEEFEILFSLLFKNNRIIAGLFDDFIDKEDLKLKLKDYKNTVESSSLNQGRYRRVSKEIELQDIQYIYNMLFGEINNVPLQLNRGFKEATKYRLEIGK
jgi:hypothetical protein